MNIENLDLLAHSAGQSTPPTPEGSFQHGGRDPTRIAVTILSLVLLAGVAFFLGRRIESPEQAIANAQPPNPTLISVPVESRILGDEIIFRADVILEGSEDVVIASNEGQPVITEVLVAPGDSVMEGEALLAFNGRRVVALAGELPMYRDLVPFVEGPDVSQLQQSLVRLGYSIGLTGVFDLATQKSALAMLQAAGLVLDGSGSAEQREAVSIAREGLKAASDGVIDAREGLTAAKEGKVLAIAAAEGGVEAATENQRFAVIRADQLEAGPKAGLVAAQLVLNGLLAGDSPDPVTVAKAKGEVQIAKDLVELKSADANIIRQDARRGLEAATAAAVSAREISVAASERQVTAAKGQVKGAQSDLDAALREAGLTIPQHSIKYISALPASVVSSGASVGLELSEIEGPSFTLSNGSLVAQAGVDFGSVLQLSQGIKVEASLGDTVVEGIIAKIVEDDGQDESYLAAKDQIRIEFSEPPPEVWQGVNVKVIVAINRTDEPVMAVPSSGIFSDPTGQTYVRRLASSDVTEQVFIDVGVIARGYVQINPVTEGELNIGDLVEVGAQ